jgi:hypothetical protein
MVHLFYDDDDVYLLGRSFHNIKKKAKNLVVASNEFELEGNGDKN